MAGSVGRQIVIEWGGAQLLGVREKGITMNGTPVDVSSDEDSGIRHLLENISGESMVDVSVSGVSKDAILKAAWMSDGAGRTKSMEITWPNGDTLTFNARLISYDEKGPYKDAVTFDGKFQSTGAWAYVPYS